MGGATIIPRSSPRTTRNEKNFQDRPKIFFFKSYMTLKYLVIIDFPKFEPLTAAEMWKSWAKMSKFIPLSLRLSGIEFSLVSD
jgi:hypothetical protein